MCFWYHGIQERGMASFSLAFRVAYLQIDRKAFVLLLLSDLWKCEPTHEYVCPVLCFFFFVVSRRSHWERKNSSSIWARDEWNEEICRQSWLCAAASQKRGTSFCRFLWSCKYIKVVKRPGCIRSGKLMDYLILKDSHSSDMMHINQCCVKRISIKVLEKGIVCCFSSFRLFIEAVSPIKF